jgi:hypothetical protein
MKRDWYPTSTGNAHQDETQRIIFQNLYYLRDQMDGKNNAAADQRNGISTTMSFSFLDANNNAVPVSLVIGGKNFRNMTFQNGLLVAVS